MTTSSPRTQYHRATPDVTVPEKRAVASGDRYSRAQEKKSRVGVCVCVREREKTRRQERVVIFLRLVCDVRKAGVRAERIESRSRVNRERDVPFFSLLWR